MEDGTYGYYNQKLNKLMTEAEMKPLLDSGEAAEYDYDNEDQLNKESSTEYGAQKLFGQRFQH